MTMLADRPRSYLRESAGFPVAAYVHAVHTPHGVFELRRDDIQTAADALDAYARKERKLRELIADVRRAELEMRPAEDANLTALAIADEIERILGVCQEDKR